MVTASVVLLLGLGGCGSDDPSSDAEPAVASGSPSESSDEPTESSDEPTVETSPGESSVDPAGASSTELTAENFGPALAAAQAEAQSAHFEGTTELMEGQSLKLSGDVQAGSRLEDLAMQMTANLAEQGTLEVRLLEGDVYIKVPTVDATSAEKPWLKFSLDDPNNPLSAALGQFMSTVDPMRIQQTYGSITDLENLGPDEVDGVEVTHYRVTVDTAQALGGLDLGGSGKAEMRKLLKQMPKTLSSEVWIDSDMHLAKLTSDVLGVTSEMNFSRWGEPVSVKAPPRGQVTEAPLR
ncbi:MAG: hypothetical protein ACR2GB_06830 [Nocardioidaceae bacterium]